MKCRRLSRNLIVAGTRMTEACLACDRHPQKGREAHTLLGPT